MNQMKFL